MNNSMQDFAQLEQQEMEYKVKLQTTQNAMQEKIKSLSEKTLTDDLRNILTKVSNNEMSVDEVKDTIQVLTQMKENYIEQMKLIYAEIKDLQTKMQ